MRTGRLAIAGLLLAGAVAHPASALARPGDAVGYPARPAAPAAAPAAGVAAGAVAVTMDRPTATSVLGEHLTVRSTVVNTGMAPSGRLFAHLDIVSLRADVYTDPEDWSADRTVDIGALPPGGRTTLSWTVHSVKHGEFDLYVVLLPVGPPHLAGPLGVSEPVRLAVTQRKAINAGSSLAVVLTVPVLVGLLAGAGRLRRRRAAQRR